MSDAEGWGDGTADGCPMCDADVGRLQAHIRQEHGDGGDGE